MLITAAQRFDDAILCLGRVTRRLRGEKMNPLEMAGIPGDILRLREGYASLDTTLRLAFFFISDQWPSIENNRIRLGELHDFAGSFSRFCGAVTSFDDAVIANESLAFQLMGPYEASREYAALASLYAGLFRPIFDAAQSILPVPKPHLSPLQGLCEDLRDYFTGKTDKDMEEALLRGLPGGPKGNWNGTLTQATYFGQHFKVTAQVMNRLFFFTDKYGRPTKAHFSRYKSNRIVPDNPFALILSKYPRKG